MAKNKLRIIIVSIFVLFAFLISCGLFFYLELTSFIKKPVNPSAVEKIFTIKAGQSLAVIAKNLEKESIISNKTYFTLFTKIKKAGKNLQAGEYLLSASKSPDQILKILIKICGSLP